MLKELLTIGEYPNFSLLPPRLFSERAGTLFKTYGLLFIAILLVAPLILATDGFVVHALHFKTINKVQNDGMRHFFQKLGYWKAAAYVCLIGPLLEETIFRLPLSLKKIPICLAFATAVFLFSGFLFLHIHIISALVRVVVRLLLAATVLLICIFLIPKGLSITNHRFRKQLIILSMCLFALMHVGNYSPIQWQLIWIYPVYVIPQFLMGWAITYIRFKSGFWWGFILHCIINSVSILLSYGRL